MDIQAYLDQYYSEEIRISTSKLNLNHQNLEGHLDLKNFTDLESLEVNYNQLTSIDFSDCSKLKEVSVIGNRLTSIYLSRQPNLISLACANNKLKFLDLSGNRELKNLFAYNNQLTNLNFLDQLEFPEKLKRLDISNNKFTPTSLAYFQFFPNLKTLLIANNHFYGAMRDIENLTRLRISSFDNTEIEIKIKQVSLILEKNLK